MDDVEHTEYCVVDSPGWAVAAGAGRVNDDDEGGEVVEGTNEVVVGLESSMSHDTVARGTDVTWYRRRNPSFVTLPSVVNWSSRSAPGVGLEMTESGLRGWVVKRARLSVSEPVCEGVGARMCMDVSE